MPKFQRLIFVFIFLPSVLFAQNTMTMALTDTAQMRQAIVALRDYNPHEGQTSWMSDAAQEANDHAWGQLADALELSLDFKVGHVLNAVGAGMIQIALKRKHEKDIYYASKEYKDLKYKEDHPVYTLKDGSIFDISKATSEWFGTNEEGYSVGKKTITFQRISPGVFKQR